jgi:hypothetical protein
MTLEMPHKTAYNEGPSSTRLWETGNNMKMTKGCQHPVPLAKKIQ